MEIIWVRRNLRIEDNRLFSQKCVKPLLLYIFDPFELSNTGTIRANFIFHQLQMLKEKLSSFGLKLYVFHAEPEKVFYLLEEKHKIFAIYSSFLYNKYDRELLQKLSQFNAKDLNDNYLLNDFNFITKNGKPFKVYTQYRNEAFKYVGKLCEQRYEFSIKDCNTLPFDDNSILRIEGRHIVPHPFDLKTLGYEQIQLREEFIKRPEDLLEDFKEKLPAYELERDFPAKNSTSYLSAHLSFGTISVRKVFSWALSQKSSEKFLDELMWREFFNYILKNFPETEDGVNLQPVDIEWDYNQDRLKSWQEGKTGVPLIDAGMRQLNNEGYIHNRVRMVVASFLVKNLHINWLEGEKYFAKQLTDYDPASNIGNWQWVSGIGTDPKSLYRIYNPYIQSQKFDPECEYIKKYVPELRSLEPEKIHSEEYLLKSTVSNYPKPIVKFSDSAKEFGMRRKRKERRGWEF